MRRVQDALVARAVEEGPQALNVSERRRVLRDPEALQDLHRLVWQIADRDRAARWGLVPA